MTELVVGDIHETKDGRIFQIKTILGDKRRRVVARQLYKQSPEYYTGLTAFIGYRDFQRMILPSKEDTP